MNHILLIEADAGERRIVESRLIDRGHEVLCAETGAKGLVEARSAAVDLVLVASHLGGGVDGAEVCRRIKAIPKLNNVPVVIYADRGLSSKTGDRMYDSGCEAFVSKAQMPNLDRVVEAHLRIKARNDELAEQNRLLELENRRMDEECQRVADLEASESHGGTSSLVFRELAAGRPDGVLVVDGSGVVRHADRGACELLGKDLIGRTLGKLVPASGLEAFVRDARTAPREGFRFDLSPRKDRARRALSASVVPVTASTPEADVVLRVVLLIDLGRRRVAEEILRTQEPGIPRQQLGALVDAARATFTSAAIVGSSPAARDLVRRIGELAGHSGPILLSGEPGSGKELVARILHYDGPSTGCFLQVHCSALSTESLEYELFGYCKDAFPGALADRPGLLLLAQDGTLLLEEVAELPITIQERLVEALGQGFYHRSGSSRRERLECRIVASTTRDLDELVAAGEVLGELRDRLAANTVRVPALRERPGDERELAASFLAHHGARFGMQGMAPDAQWLVGRYDWPGNVAELEACIEQASRRAQGGRVEVAHLSGPLRDLAATLPERDVIPAVRPAGQAAAAGVQAETVQGTHVSSLPYTAHPIKPWDITEDDPISLDLYEKKALLRALDCCDGDKLAAARLLEVGKSTLYRKLKKFGIT